MYIGIDVGGTHTDAVLCHAHAVLAYAKVKTHAAHVALSVRHVLQTLQETLARIAPECSFAQVQRVTLSTTLGLNAMVQGKTAAVGLIYTAGSGMDPQRFLQHSVMNAYVHRVEGALDHRGSEVTPLCLTGLAQVIKNWQEQGVENFAIVGKFSVRNSIHEKKIAAELVRLGIAENQITLAHPLSGQLNFPRRMAAAYMNATIQKVQQAFLLAVQDSVRAFSVHAPLYLLKADGGAIPFEAAYACPLYTVLSGPAASVMGAMVPFVFAKEFLQRGEDALLIDMGGTTTDIAVYAAGLPVLDVAGMSITVPRLSKEDAVGMSITAPRLPKEDKQECLLTPIRSLATHSLSLGGDSPLCVEQGKVSLSSVRQGAAMAFGGAVPTLVDALMVLDGSWQEADAEYMAARQRAQQSVTVLATAQGMECAEFAKYAVQEACARICQGIEGLLTRLAQQPVYTLAQLLHGYEIQPTSLCLVGGPALLLRPWLAPYVEQRLGIQVYVPDQSVYANALGAALTLPTAHVELLADTLQGFWHIPTLGLQGNIDKKFTLDDAIALAKKALQETRQETVQGAHMDVIEAESFATLDMSGRGGKDIRVVCQWRPGIVAH